MKDHLQLQEDSNVAVRAMSRGKLLADFKELCCQRGLRQLMSHRFQDELSRKNGDKFCSLVDKELNMMDRNLPAVRDIDDDLHNVQDTDFHVPVKPEDRRVILMNADVHNPAYRTLVPCSSHGPLMNVNGNFFAYERTAMKGERTMVFQRQGEFECFPTTVAMLLGLSKDEVVRTALHGTEWKTWVEMMNGTAMRPDLRQRIYQRAAQLLPNLFRKSMSAVIPFYGQAPVGELDLPPGRGAVVLQYRDSQGTPLSRHILPYEDGRVLDPAGPGFPETLLECLARLGRGWSMEQIVREEKEALKT